MEQNTPRKSGKRRSALVSLTDEELEFLISSTGSKTFNQAVSRLVSSHIKGGGALPDPSGFSPGCSGLTDKLDSVHQDLIKWSKGVLAILKSKGG